MVEPISYLPELPEPDVENPLYEAWKIVDWLGTARLFDVRWTAPTSADVAEAAEKLAEFGVVVDVGYWGDMALALPFAVRTHFVRRYAWAVPDDRALSLLEDLGPIVEVGAGVGYWAHLLQQRGVDVVALDLVPVETGENGWHNWRAGCEENVVMKSWTHVMKPTMRGLSLYADRTLLLCWPPYDTRMAVKTLRRYPGDTLVYVGESEMGCNGTPEFFEELRGRWTQVDSRAIPQWEGIHDELTVWKRL